MQINQFASVVATFTLDSMDMNTNIMKVILLKKHNVKLTVEALHQDHQK